ncbi:MAG: hypothetical protein M1561_03090, partial [Gammaproteobacteria bacterium]|nr:hypothetical protein [Gammaproteobacteria bacterium]
MAKLKFKQLDTISSMITSAVNAYIKAGKTKDIASYDTDQITHDLYQQGKFTKKSLGLFKSEVPGQAGIDRANKFLAEIQGKSELDV